MSVDEKYVHLADAMRELPIESVRQTDVWMAGVVSKLHALSDPAFDRLLLDLDEPMRAFAHGLRAGP